MDLNARVDVNCGQKDGRTDGRTENRTPKAKAGATKNSMNMINFSMRFSAIPQFNKLLKLDKMQTRFCTFYLLQL